MDLSVIIAARNEEFLQRTINEVIDKKRGDTEVIVIVDGYWDDIKQDKCVKIIHHNRSIGQRAAVNEGARLSDAKFIMKLDAHCALDEGFDVKLMEDCEYDWTVVPRMHNLHAFDWVCNDCGTRTYQGHKICKKCKSTNLTKDIIWRSKNNSIDYMWFDTDLKFRYFDSTCLDLYGVKNAKQIYSHYNRDWAKGDITDQMTCLGACWFMHRRRFLDLGGLDEDHGSWGQMGTEIACKSWLSGGRQVVNKKTWFAHMFRTQGGDFGFPYPLSGKEVRTARNYSRELWTKNKWPKAVRKLSWMIDRFSPLPGWDKKETIEVIETKEPTKGLVYYTDNQTEERLLSVVRDQIKKGCNGHKIVSVSQYPIDFGENIVMPLQRSQLTLFKQMLAGIEAIDTDIIFFVEHDVLYHPDHFKFTPPRKDKFYYNTNCWMLRPKDGFAITYDHKSTSGVCAYRDLMLSHYRARVERVEKEGWSRRMGYAPGNHKLPRGFDYSEYETWRTEFPNVDIRHGNNISGCRFSQDKFRRKPKNWIEAYEIPGWGKTGGRFDEWLREVSQL